MLYHAIQNTVDSTINATYARRMMGKLYVIPLNKWLSCILISSIFFGMVKILFYYARFQPNAFVASI